MGTTTPLSGSWRYCVLGLEPLYNQVVSTETFKARLSTIRTIAGFTIILDTDRFLVYFVGDRQVLHFYIHQDLLEHMEVG